MEKIIILGLIAGTLTTISFLPQVIKTWKLKETRDISLWMYVILAIGILGWLSYGLLTNDLPIIIANAVGFILISIIIFLKLKYG